MTKSPASTAVAGKLIVSPTWQQPCTKGPPKLRSTLGSKSQSHFSQQMFSLELNCREAVLCFSSSFVSY